MGKPFVREDLITAESMTYNVDRYWKMRSSGNSYMQLRASDKAQSSNNAAIEADSDCRWKLLIHLKSAFGLLKRHKKEAVGPSAASFLYRIP